MPARLGVQILGPVRDRADRPPLVVAERLEPLLQLAPHALVVVRGDDALRLAPLDVEEEAAVVAALAPRDGARPVDEVGRETRRLGRLLAQHEVPLAAQPLVDADAAVHPLRAVVRDDEHRRVVVREPQQARDLRVEPLVVVEHRVLVGIARLEQPVLGVGEAPEAVVDAVGAHLDHEEQVPRAASRAGARRGGTASRSSPRSGRAGGPCPRCGSSRRRPCSGRRPARSRPSARADTCSGSSACRASGSTRPSRP